MVMQVKLLSYDLSNKTFVNLGAVTKLEAETNKGNLLSEICEVLVNHSLLWQSENELICPYSPYSLDKA